MFSKNFLLCVFTAFAALSQSAPTSSPALEPVHSLSIRAGTELSKRTITPPSCDNDPTKCLITELIFQTSIADFIQKRDDPKYKKKKKKLIWDSDGCSVPPKVAKLFKIDKDKPFGFNFLDSCYRHDFGYRNYIAQGMFKADDFVTDPDRHTLNEVFLQDLKDWCNVAYPNNIYNLFGLLNFVGKKCGATALVYYLGVEACGAGNCDADTLNGIFVNGLPSS
ncbi:hypothetical protein TWF696_003752 [Orbilia brochopaga]|uniref:Uncharacterized protein n=1 Tax=Orbilia brochopaga TaxID=3140254 RepID=A0AAV9V6E4_9PEZI